jgi:hypothetical protein
VNAAPRSTLVRRFAAAIGVALLAAACGGQAVERTGFLTVTWRIDGTRDPALCADYGVEAMELAVYDRYENFVGEVEAPCQDFATTVELPPDLYHVDATLIGFADEAKSDTALLEDLDVFEDSELVVDVDYPPDWF